MGMLTRAISAFKRTYNHGEDNPPLRSVSAEGNTLRVETVFEGLDKYTDEEALAQAIATHEGVVVGVFQAIIAVDHLPTPDGVKGVMISDDVGDVEDVMTWSVSTDVVRKYSRGELTDSEMVARIDESKIVW